MNCLNNELNTQIIILLLLKCDLMQRFLVITH